MSRDLLRKIRAAKDVKSLEDAILSILEFSSSLLDDAMIYGDSRRRREIRQIENALWDLEINEGTWHEAKERALAYARRLMEIAKALEARKKEMEYMIRYSKSRLDKIIRLTTHNSLRNSGRDIKIMLASINEKAKKLREELNRKDLVYEEARKIYEDVLNLQSSLASMKENLLSRGIGVADVTPTANLPHIRLHHPHSIAGMPAEKVEAYLKKALSVLDQHSARLKKALEITNKVFGAFPREAEVAVKTMASIYNYIVRHWKTFEGHEAIVHSILERMLVLCDEIYRYSVAYKNYLLRAYNSYLRVHPGNMALSKEVEKDAMMLMTIGEEIDEIVNDIEEMAQALPQQIKDAIEAKIRQIRTSKTQFDSEVPKIHSTASKDAYVYSPGGGRVEKVRKRFRRIGTRVRSFWGGSPEEAPAHAEQLKSLYSTWKRRLDRLRGFASYVSAKGYLDMEEFVSKEKTILQLIENLKMLEAKITTTGDQGLIAEADNQIIQIEEEIDSLESWIVEKAREAGMDEEEIEYELGVGRGIKGFLKRRIRGIKGVGKDAWNATKATYNFLRSAASSIWEMIEGHLPSIDPSNIMSYLFNIVMISIAMIISNIFLIGAINRYGGNSAASLPMGNDALFLTILFVFMLWEQLGIKTLIARTGKIGGLTVAGGVAVVVGATAGVGSAIKRTVETTAKTAKRAWTSAKAKVHRIRHRRQKPEGLEEGYEAEEEAQEEEKKEEEGQEGGE